MTNLFKVNGQELTPIETYPAVSDTVNYLTFAFMFSYDWAGLTKSAIFTKGTDIYEVVLTDDQVLESDHVNLSAGVWSISVVGDTVVDAVVTRQITTSSYDYTVTQSGATSGGVFPPSIASQVYVNVNQATPQTFVGGIPKLAADRVIDHDNELADKKYVDDHTPPAPVHNDLGGLQGGSAGEYYHVTAAEKTVISNTSGTNTGDQDVSGAISTHNADAGAHASLFGSVGSRLTDVEGNITELQNTGVDTTARAQLTQIDPLTDLISYQLQLKRPVLASYSVSAPSVAPLASSFSGWARQINYSGQNIRFLNILARTEIAGVVVTAEIVSLDQSTVIATATALSTGTVEWLLFGLDKLITPALITESGFYVRIFTAFGSGCRLRADMTVADYSNHNSAYKDYYTTIYDQSWVNTGSNVFGMAIRFGDYPSMSIGGTSEAEQFNDLLMPSKIYAVANKEVNIYYDALCRADYKNYLWKMSCNLGVAQDERWTNNSVLLNGYAINAYLHSKQTDLLDTKAATLAMAAASAKTGENPKCLFIGDSLTASNLYTGELLTLMGSDAAMDVTLIGTKGSSPNVHEGVSGWTINKFYTDATSPFVFSGSFNFSQYMSTNALSGCDYVFIFLGINDIFSLATTLAVDALWTTAKTQLDGMITSIKAYNPSVKICIMPPPPPSNHQDAFGKNYFSAAWQWQYKERWHTLVYHMLSDYDNRVADNIYIVPAYCNIDTERNMQTESVAANSRNSTVITRQSNGVHPSANGYYQIADAVYYFLKNV